MSITRITELPPLPPRPADGHKGLFGRVLIVGGNDDMIGAPILAGTAALRMGSGLVQVGMPRAVLAMGLSITPELIGLGLPKTPRPKALRDAAKQADALAIGPGLGTSETAAGWLAELSLLDKPLVIDADGLNLLAKRRKWPKRFPAQAVLTPHPGEMRRLAPLFGYDDVPTDDDGRVELAAACAEASGQVFVLKGARTVVTDGQRAFVNTTGDSSLSKAGSGDVLTGMIASLLGQGMERFEAACLAVYLHGRAGELAGQHLGQRSVLARDVIDSIAEAICEMDVGTLVRETAASEQE